MFHLVGTRIGHPVGTGSCHGVKKRKISDLNQVQGHLYQNEPRANKLNRQDISNSKGLKLSFNVNQ